MKSEFVVCPIPRFRNGSTTSKAVKFIICASCLLSFLRALHLEVSYFSDWDRVMMHPAYFILLPLAGGIQSPTPLNLGRACDT